MQKIAIVQACFNREVRIDQMIDSYVQYLIRSQHQQPPGEIP